MDGLRGCGARMSSASQKINLLQGYWREIGSPESRKECSCTQPLIENAVEFPQLSVRRKRKGSTELPAHLA